jgi:hypothetical protein
MAQFLLRPPTCIDTGGLSQRKWNKMRAVKFISWQRSACWEVDKRRGTHTDRPGRRAFFHQLLNGAGMRTSCRKPETGYLLQSMPSNKLALRIDLDFAA